MGGRKCRWKVQRCALALAHCRGTSEGEVAEGGRVSAFAQDALVADADGQLDPVEVFEDGDGEFAGQAGKVLEAGGIDLALLLDVGWSACSASRSRLCGSK